MKYLKDATSSPKESIKIIADNMINIRPASNVFYAPYKKSEIYYDMPLVDGRRIDLKKLYPNAVKGDFVYISTVFEACNDSLARICFAGKADIFINGKQVEEVDENQCEIFLKKGKNPVTFRAYCTENNEFVFTFMPATTRYVMWAKYYLLNVRATSPIPEFFGEDGVGISKLYTKHEEFDDIYVYPKIEKIGNFVDIDKIFHNRDGLYCYAVSYALDETELIIETKNKYNIFVNGEEKNGNVSLKKGDCVLLKIHRDGKNEFSFNNAKIGIPFLKSSRNDGDKWLLIDCDNDNIGEIQFSKPYTKKNGEKVFWRLAGNENYLRPYLPTRFFGQWFYALMVGSYGLLQASNAINSKEYKDYFINSMSVLHKYFDLMQYERKVFGQPSFLEISTDITNLDAIGAVG